MRSTQSSRTCSGDVSGQDAGSARPVLPSFITQLAGGDRKPPPRLGQGRVHTLSDLPPHVLVSHEEKRRRIYDAIDRGCVGVRDISLANDSQIPDQEIRAIATELQEEGYLQTRRVKAPSGGTRLNYETTGKGRPA